jgi:hypothetical protein
VAHVPGTRGSPALREPSIPPIRYPRVCWQKRDRPIRCCSTPRKFTGTMFSKQAALRVVSRRKTASSPGACAVHKQPWKLALSGRGREASLSALPRSIPLPSGLVVWEVERSMDCMVDLGSFVWSLAATATIV